MFDVLIRIAILQLAKGIRMMISRTVLGAPSIPSMQLQVLGVPVESILMFLWFIQARREREGGGAKEAILCPGHKVGGTQRRLIY